MKQLLVILSFLLIIISVKGQSYTTVKVEITQIVDIDSPLYIAIYDDPSTFKSKSNAVDSAMIIPNTSTARYVFSNLMEGEYAVAVFQDINGNGILDTGKLRIPKEPFGISNINNQGKKGIPTFDKAKIKINGDTTVSIPLISKK